MKKSLKKKINFFFPFDLFSIFISLASGKENVQFPDSPDFDILSDMMSSRPLEQIPHFPRMFHRACLPYGSGKANLFFIKPQQGKAGLYRSFIRLPSKSITSVIWPNIAGLIWTVVIVFGWNWNQVELQSYGQSWRSSLGQGIQCTTLVLLNLYSNSNIQGRHGEIFYPNFFLTGCFL